MFQTTVALVIFLFPLAFSPGPGNLFFAANGARFGFRATLPANVGYHVATWIVTVAIGFGFLAVIENQPQAFTVLRIAGSLYVFWIAWKMLKAGVLTSTEDAKPATFFDGVVLLAFNPKAYVIIGLMFTQFLDARQTGTLVAILFIATVFTINNLVAFSAWTLAGDYLAKMFRSPKTAKRLNIVFGTLLASVALWMLLS
ncbi:MAG: LysE family translocator [Boseongicola sp.]|nr:LysE family translocator [Boseongicola sp.]MDD9976336.1 LysE family translocator [Boseongicola sp.]